jgi:hypothetical protein
MSPRPAPSFSPRLIGQTEKALNAILIRDGTGLSEPVASAGRLLATVLGRANEELGYSI